MSGSHLFRWTVGFEWDGQYPRLSRWSLSQMDSQARWSTVQIVKGSKGANILVQSSWTILYSSSKWLVSDHDMQAQRECPKQIWQRGFLFPSGETNVSYQEQDKKIETQNIIDFSDLPGFLSSLELAFSWSSWFSSLSPFAPGCCNKRCRFREGFTKKVAVLLDFFQMRGGPAQFFWHLFISALLVNKRSRFPAKCQ